jgi:ABC-type Fe3+/spermidine/putrescine transport system ATPase subunit
MRTQMERVEDVMQYPVDASYRDEPLSDEADYDKLYGKVELKNVTFGYARLGDPVVEDFSMTVEPGASVAFVGASGCGKSTLSKLIAGLYQPWSGEILFDGKPASEIDRSVFTGSVAVVDQDIILFEDTIANNISMWDESIEDFEIILAARDAQGKLVGALFGLTDYAYWLYITDLGVDRDYTHQGIGRHLMQTAHQLAGGEKDIAVYLIANEKAVPFYEKCGMKKADDVMQYNHIEWTAFTVT